MNISDLQTPALLLDKPAMERNMEKIDALRQGTSMALYPHYKSHKCPAIAKLQLARGARGITCAKLSEALDLAQAGVKNIVIANQVVQAEKLPVLARLPIDPAVAEAYDNGQMETVNTEVLRAAVEAIENA